MSPTEFAAMQSAYVPLGLARFDVFGAGAKATPLFAAGIETTAFGSHGLVRGLSRMRGDPIFHNVFM